jgi:hypothetical protein
VAAEASLATLSSSPGAVRELRKGRRRRRRRDGYRSSASS